jgi:hypothetical protein
MCATNANQGGDSAGKAGAAARAVRAARAGAAAAGLRVEPVDNWHPAWEAVLQHVARHGAAVRLRVDAEGWLSARQVLMVALVGDAPVAHLCFSVSPSKAGCIEAAVESHGIDPAHGNRGIESQLHRAATERAHALRCSTLKGFRLGSKWC